MPGPTTTGHYLGGASSATVAKYHFDKGAALIYDEPNKHREVELTWQPPTRIW